MSRPEFPVIVSSLIDSLARRSTCERLNVACVIVSADYQYIFSWGYNGSISGKPNKCEDKHKVGNCGCIHAEANALNKVPFEAFEYHRYGCYLFCTVAPCESCATLIVESELFTKVFYKNSYRIEDGINLLKKNNIEAIKIG